jgi:LacI family transcriptional regulator
MLCCNDQNATLQEEQVALLRDRMVDGLIMSPTGKDDQLRDALEQTDIPVVLIDRTLKGFDCDSVLLDNRGAVADAMRYLIGLGHRRIGIVSGAMDSFTGGERLAGYRLSLASVGLPYDPELVQFGNFRIDDAYDATMRLMTLPKPPTAVFSANNQMVIGVMKALRDLGLDCPKDLSVAGLDDFPWADAFKPQLTTVAQPVEAFGQQAARMLLERIGGEALGPPRHMILKGELRVRESCRPLT